MKDSNDGAHKLTDNCIQTNDGKCNSSKSKLCLIHVLFRQIAEGSSFEKQNRTEPPLLPPSIPPPHIILSAGEDNNQWDFQMHQHQKAI